MTKCVSMANVHWRVSFRTRSEKLGVLNLYDNSYSGSPIDLTPAAVPFETQEDSADAWFVPIRKQTGYIRVLDEGNTDGIMPVGMKDRYVEYTEDGTLKWCGYVVPDVFSSDWDVMPNEVEFPVIGGLGVLEGVYLNEDDGLGLVTLGKLLHQCLRETGIDYDTVYVPKEVLRTVNSTDFLFPLTIEVSRYNFFRDNESLNAEDSDWTRYNGETCYDVVSEIMKFWGWTMRERGKELWITSTINGGSVGIPFSGLQSLDNGGVSSESVSSAEHEISSFELAGSDHKRDVLQGRKKVVVNAAVRPVGVVVPSIDISKMKYLESYKQQFGSDDQTYAHEKLILYTPSAGYVDVSFRTYIRAGAGGGVSYPDWTMGSQATPALFAYVGAYFVEQEKVTSEEYEKKKNWNLTETIRINLEDWSGDYPTVTDAMFLPILIMKSRNVANYTNGAFVISAQTRSISEGLLADYDGNGKGNLEIRFKIGTMYWNGTGWTKVPSWFIVEMGNEEDPESKQGTGKIISTKTLDMPYNGADGYVMPINQALSGEVELTIHAVRNDGGYKVLMLDNFKVDYYGVDTDRQKSDRDTNRYARETGLNSNNEEEINLSMATDKNNKAGYGILSYDGENVGNLYFVENGTDRPEMNLVKKGVSQYGRTTEKLTLHLERKEINPHDVMVRNGKKYVLASEAVNWQEETGQYVLMDL